jgi:hypothetical protein
MFLDQARSRGLSLPAIAIGLLLPSAALVAQPFTLQEYQVQDGLTGIASASNGSVWCVSPGAPHSVFFIDGGVVTPVSIPASDFAKGAIATIEYPIDVWFGGTQNLLSTQAVDWQPPSTGPFVKVPLLYPPPATPIQFQSHRIEGIAYDGANLWYTDLTFNTPPPPASALYQSTLWSLALPGNSPPVQLALPGGCDAPAGPLVRGIDGNIWFLSSRNGQQNACRVVLPANTVDSFTLPYGSFDGSIANGPDGRIWVSGYDGPHGYLQAFNPSACPGPNCQCPGPNCEVFTPFNLPGGGTAREIHGITAGPDDRIWFTFVKDVEGIGTVKTDGTDFQVVSLPTAGRPNGNNPDRIVAGPPGDNSVWFTEPNSGYVGRIGGLAASTELFLQNGRFKLDVTWQVPPQGTSGVGTAIPVAPDTGAFWFFSPNNLELLVKVLDGHAINGHWWVFIGSLTNVEFDLTVTDLVTGAVQTYHNAYGTQASIQDTSAFSIYAPPPEQSTVHEIQGAASPFDPADLVRAELGMRSAAPAPEAQTACTPDAQTLCLNASRFKVQVAWDVPPQGTSGVGTAGALTGDTGTFWFFSSNNLELIIKVLDARAINNHFWVFYGSLSNVEYTITITDTVTGAVRAYHNPYQNVASFSDTSAF